MKFAMNDGILPIGHSPYILRKAAKRSRRKPTPRQQLILDQMRQGIWYQREPPKDRHDSCNALVCDGWLVVARIAKKGNDGKLVELTVDELLFDFIGSRNWEEPLVMYRLVKDGE